MDSNITQSLSDALAGSMNINALLIHKLKIMNQLFDLISDNDIEGVRTFILENKDNIIISKAMYMVKNYDMFLVIVENISYEDIAEWMVDGLLFSEQREIIDYTIRRGIDPTSLINMCMDAESADTYDDYRSDCECEGKDSSSTECIGCVELCNVYDVVVYIIIKYGIDTDELRKESDNKLLDLILDNLPVDV